MVVYEFPVQSCKKEGCCDIRRIMNRNREVILLLDRGLIRSIFGLWIQFGPACFKKVLRNERECRKESQKLY